MKPYHQTYCTACHLKELWTNFLSLIVISKIFNRKCVSVHVYIIFCVYQLCKASAKFGYNALSSPVLATLHFLNSKLKEAQIHIQTVTSTV